MTDTFTLPRRGVHDVVDGAIAAVAATVPSTTIGFDQLWRTARRRTRRSYAAAPGARALDLATASPDDLRTARSAAIVGSGPSARLVRSEVWAEHLGGVDVFALNHAAAIAPEPVICSVEPPVLQGRQVGLTDDQGVRFLEWAVRGAVARRPDVTLVVRATTLDPVTQRFAERFSQHGAATFVAMQAALPVRGARGSERFARWATARHAFRWPRPGQPFVCARGGLGFLVALCIALGYEDITLFGIDLYSDEYFFDGWTGDPELAEYLEALGPPRARPHATAATEGDRPGVVDALAAIDRYVMRPSGRSISVASEQSLLYPMLPLARPSS